MCGIAAFSKPEGSTLNSRHLAHHLLTQIESRGSHASGFSYINADGKVGIYKNPVPGSQLSLHELPRDARTVILHTRYATQGPQSDNRNNHPVISTDRRIALVHNGVISNDGRLRGELGITKEHGEVDSLVIPSLISQQGTDGLKELSGYAAIAWLDVEHPTDLYIARLKNSPVAYTHLFDGTFVMASTPALLELALLNANEIYGGIFELQDSRMITVTGGFIYEYEKAPLMSYDYGSYRRHSTATSGGAKATSAATTKEGTTLAGVTPIRGTEDRPKVVIPEREDETVDIDGYYADLDQWRANQAERDAKIAGKAMALLKEDSGRWDDGVWEEYMAQLEAREAEEQHMSCTADGSESQYGEGFYILDAEGDISHYTDLELLERQLKWLAEMSRTDNDLFDAEEKINWINHIMDLGHVESDGELVSWVDDSASVDEFESPAVRNLAYIREGANRLATLKGA